MSRLLTPPEIDWTPAGAPVARAHGDVYFSAEDGLAETRTVFLAACGLPDAWVGRHHFTVAETGFGTGLNFLALWQMWRAHRPAPNAQITFVSFEGFPLRAGDAARALSAWPELASLASALLGQWPAPVKGVRQLTFPDDGVRLVLHLGDIAQTLPASRLTADAWFLDGFSPAKNASMWDAAIFAEIAARSAPGARLGTFTVAGAVRRGLAQAGFEVVRAEGHGRKRERLEAQIRQPPPAAADLYGLGSPGKAPRRIAILGAGIAGAALAQALKERGLAPEVFDPAPQSASGASGNPAALVMPRLDVGETAEAGLLIDAYLAARAAYLGGPGAELVDVLQRPRTPADAARFEKLLADPPLPLEDLEAVRGGGLLHKRALILRPAPLIARLLTGISCHLGSAVDVRLDALTVCERAFDAIVLANGMQASWLAPGLSLEARLGQVDFVASPVAAPPSATASGTYALATGSLRLWGATFAPSGDDFEANGTPEARVENLAGLERLSPWWVREAAGDVHSRASLRATTSDRLPLIGAVPDASARLLDGVYAATGYGARGFTWAPWAASVLAAQLTGAPPPAPTAALRAVSPLRFEQRARKRR